MLKTVEKITGNSIFAYAFDNSIFVNNTGVETGTVTVYNMLGQVVATQKLTDGLN